MELDALLKLHCDLPQEGPGSDEATLDALRRLPPLPSGSRVFDLGCGPGRHTLVLARALDTRIVAVDLYKQFLVQLREAATDANLSDRIETRVGDMSQLDEPPESIDLIWSEAAVYTIGFERGLRYWHSLLKPAGFAVVSEATWLDPTPPPEAIAFWEQEYPEMTDISSNLELATKAGYKVFDHFILNRAAWDAYYNPLRDRVGYWRSQTNLDENFLQVLDETEREIEVFDRYGDSFGYVFYLMQKK
jgi:serine/threonine-protein kinase HipA